MKYLFIVFLILFVSISCSIKEKQETNRTPFLEVAGKYLYKDEIDNIIPKNATLIDSANVADRYIQRWVTEILMYENANRNISNREKIDELVEEYRKSLIIHEYEQALVAQRLDTTVSEEEMKKFYEQYGNSMLSENDLIKGLLLIVPKDAPQIEKVREWVRIADRNSVEKIEKYSLQNALSYDYFMQEWTDFSKILKKVPLSIENTREYLSSRRFDEITDSTKHYFIKISKATFMGEKEPYEIAKKRIKNTLLNKRKSDFIINFEKSMYNDAVEKGDINFMYNN